MRKNFCAVSIAAVFLATSAIAQAANNFYVGANLTRITDDGDEAPAIYPLALGVKGGLEITPNFALEARYASGVKEDSTMLSGVKVDLEVDKIYGVYAKGVIPLGRVSPYVLIGYSHGQETASVKAYGLSQSDSDSGVSYGIGIDIPITESVSVSAEWARLLKGEDDAGVGYKIEGLSVGATVYF